MSSDGRDGLVLVNGGPESVQAPRARALFEGSATILHKQRGRLGSVPALASAIRRPEHSWIYCIDLGVPGALLAVACRRPRTALVFELGDPAGALLGSQQRPRREVVVATWLDRALPPRANGLVFRGTYLREHFETLAGARDLPRSIWIPDGVDTSQFRPMRDSPEVQALRRRLGVENSFVIGLVGSIHHSPRWDLFYGWEIVDALALLRSDERFTAVIVGDGPGMPRLRARIRELDLVERVRLVGRVPHEEVPRWINLFDVAVSTQTDDAVGWGRTTAKLPEYLACGVVIISTDVGEAHRLLQNSGQTLPYKGIRDASYPARLADHLLRLSATDSSAVQAQNRALALRTFDYQRLRAQVHDFIRSVAPRDRQLPGSA